MIDKTNNVTANVMVNKEYFNFLFSLQESGKTNMFGATPYLQDRFEMSRKDASDILGYWMSNYEAIDLEMNNE